MFIGTSDNTKDCQEKIRLASMLHSRANRIIMKSVHGFIIALVLLAFSSVSIEATGDAIKSDFTALCSETHSAGLQWKNGDWHETTFRPRTYIVQKVTAL